MYFEYAKFCAKPTCLIPFNSHNPMKWALSFSLPFKDFKTVA